MSRAKPPIPLVRFLGLLLGYYQAFPPIFVRAVCDACSLIRFGPPTEWTLADPIKRCGGDVVVFLCDPCSQDPVLVTDAEARVRMERPGIPRFVEKGLVRGEFPAKVCGRVVVGVPESLSDVVQLQGLRAAASLGPSLGPEDGQAYFTLLGRSGEAQHQHKVNALRDQWRRLSIALKRRIPPRLLPFVENRRDSPVSIAARTPQYLKDTSSGSIELSIVLPALNTPEWPQHGPARIVADAVLRDDLRLARRALRRAFKPRARRPRRHGQIRLSLRFAFGRLLELDWWQRRLRRCECGRYFMDWGRNARARYCSQACASRATSREQRRRRRNE
jgi:hypothetical protein